MSKKRIVLTLAILTVFLFAACAKKEPGPPPDLTGDWVQPSGDEWYHIATISEDQIDIWWYLPAMDRRDLYWSGSFTPPTDDKEPYTWESESRFTEGQLNATYHFNRTSREETKTFTYRDGKLSYNVTAGHLRLGYTLERAEAVAESGAQTAP